MTDPYRLLNRDSHREVKRKDKTQAKTLQNLAKPWQRSKTTTFTDQSAAELDQMGWGKHREESGGEAG